MQRRDLEGLTREELIAHAERLEVPRPRTLTHAELIDEILTRSVRNVRDRARARGFLGRARDLLARVVERGLHLPDAARALRGGSTSDPWPPPPPPLPTVTLAEIYAAQGHLDRAITVLDEVIAREPAHEAALALRARLVEQSRRRGRRGAEPTPPPAPTPSPEAQPKADTAAEPEEKNVSAEREATSSPKKDEATSSSKKGEAATSPEPSQQRADQQRADQQRADQQHADQQRADQQRADQQRADQQRADDTAAEIAPEPEQSETLPERYDVDEVVGMAVDPETVYLYWEVRPTTLARARARRSDGHLVIRLVAVLPTWEGPHVEQRDLEVDALFGDRFVRDIPAGANVRLSIGWLSGGDFEPFAVGLEIAAPRAIPGSARPAPAPAPAVAPAPPPQPAPLPAAPPQEERTHLIVPVPPGEAHALPSAGLHPVAGRWTPPTAPRQEPPTPPSVGPERFPSGTVPSPDAIARAVAATRGGSSELAMLDVPGPGAPGAPGAGAPPVESWFYPAGSSELARPGVSTPIESWYRGGASDLARTAPIESWYRGGASDLTRTAPIESWFRGGASDLTRPGGGSDLSRGPGRT